MTTPGGKRVLVLGAAGMMGHMLCRVLPAGHEVYATTRRDVDERLEGIVPHDRLVTGIQVETEEGIERAMAIAKPDVVINCVGIVKQLKEASEAELSIVINALLPHRLARHSSASGARLIHLSTDCVFSGRSGGYTEQDVPDPLDLYGRSKHLGELSAEEGLTLRTSIVGLELERHTGLFGWVLRNRGQSVNGFARVVYSGLTTLELAKTIDRLIVDFPNLTGLYHVASEPITKYELVRELDRRLGLGMDVAKEETTVSDRSLNSARFVEATGIPAPTWSDMLDDFAADTDFYGVGTV